MISTSLDLDTACLPENDLRIIESLLKQSAHNPPELEDIWHLMDMVWDEMGCSNDNLNWDKINKYYKHPVWILNGLFIEQHDLSMQHRHAISNWIINKKFSSVLDYGGGFGTLSRLIASKDSSVQVDIYEPHPSNNGIERIKKYPNIKIINSLNQTYDCLVCVDVLEHVPDPLHLFSTMVESTREGGYLLIANNFYPVIKCHLPSTFHFRHSFDIFTRLMGLAKSGLCSGSHAMIYKKHREVTFNWRKIRFYERLSRSLYPFTEALIPQWRRIKTFLQ